MTTPMSRDQPKAYGSIVRDARRNVRWQQDYLLKESLKRILQDQSISPRDKILLQMRTNEEYRRRYSEQCASGYGSTSIPYDLSTPTFGCFRPYVNMTIALYAFDKRQRVPYVDAADVECWLWRQWFKPYMSDITLHYFSSILAVEYDANLADSEFCPEKLVAFHCNACEQVQRIRDTLPEDEDDELATPAIHGPLRTQPWLTEPERLPSEGKAAYVVQPLFRALFIALFYPQDNVNFLRPPEKLRKVKVQLLLTGMTEGLSAPISFEELRDEALDGSYHPDATAITTTLDAAVSFVMRLEQREIAAAGGVRQPDATKLRSLNRYREEAKELGWVEERDGKLDELTPRSCEWVNRDIFKKWVGKGAEETLQHAMGFFSRLNPLLKDSEENWWWDRAMLPEWPAREGHSTSSTR